MYILAFLQISKICKLYLFFYLLFAYSDFCDINGLCIVLFFYLFHFHHFLSFDLYLSLHIVIFSFVITLPFLTTCGSVCIFSYITLLCLLLHKVYIIICMNACTFKPNTIHNPIAIPAITILYRTEGCYLDIRETIKFSSLSVNIVLF